MSRASEIYWSKEKEKKKHKNWSSEGKLEAK